MNRLLIEDGDGGWKDLGSADRLNITWDIEKPHIDIPEQKTYRLDGVVLFKHSFTMPHPRTMEPMEGVKIMANWGMIPRRQG